MSNINKELITAPSEQIFNTIAERKFGPKYGKKINKLLKEFSNAHQEKFTISSEEINKKIEQVETRLNLTILDTLEQKDDYYGDSLKIRKTESFQTRVVIYKNNNGVYLARIAFNINKEIANDIRETYKSNMRVQKTRTYYNSVDGLIVTRDQFIKTIPNYETHFLVSRLNTDETNHKSQMIPFNGEIWEIHSPNSKNLELMKSFDIKFRRMEELGFTRMLGKKYPQIK